MKYLIALTLFLYSLNLTGQNYYIENYKRGFQDTIIIENMARQFTFSLENNLEIKFHSKISNDSSYVTIEFFNEDSLKNLWIGVDPGYTNFDEKVWNSLILPDFSYHSPMHFLMLRPGEKFSYLFLQKGITKMFEFTTYILNNYKKFFDNYVPEEYEPSFFDYKGHICLEIPFKLYPSEGLTWIGLGEFPVGLESNFATFTITN